jgi:hypothetical protein
VRRSLKRAARHTRPGFSSHLALADASRQSRRVDEESGIYRGEVLAIMGALADISSDTRDILAILRGDDDDEEPEEMDS